MSAQSTPLPLGERESQRLEFKRSELLSRPQQLSRAAVGMLNADGGEIWIGIQESGEEAVAAQPLKNASLSARALHDHMISAIEPSPLGSELRVEVVPLEGGAEGVLRVIVRPIANRRPYAQRKGQGRLYFVRAGARLREMSREEIHASFRGVRHEDGYSGASWLRTEREALARDGESGLWLGVAPQYEVRVDVQEVLKQGLLHDPTLSGSRESGWTFFLPGAQAKLEQGRVRLASNGGPLLSVHDTGGFQYFAPMQCLWHSDIRRFSEKLIYPFALIERIVSVFRLAKAVYGAFVEGGPGCVLAEASIFEPTGWRLRPYSPQAHGYSDVYPREPRSAGTLDADLVMKKPLLFEADDFMHPSDRCAYGIVKEIYQAFGFDAACIPSQFDRESMILKIGT